MSTPANVVRTLSLAARASAAALLLAALGCGDNQDPEGARRLWRQIHELQYRQWQRAPGYETRRATSAPHGDRVDIYINDVLVEALAAAEPLDEWPVGALIVKDGFDGSDLELVAVMDKRDDGWFWAEYDDEGDADYSGRPDLCTDCHSSGDDYVRAFGFP
jgi:hypothetical protein